MEQFIEKISKEVKAAFLVCGYEEKYGQIAISNRPDLCQYQCNGALTAAKQYKKAPIIIAKEIVEQLSEKSIFQEVQAVAPGFINLTMTSEFLADYLEEMALYPKLGYEEEKEKKTIIVDYGGANIAKPLHVGHLRSAIIGESIKRIHRFAGNHVIGDVHLGDWGLQMGLIIEQLREEKPDLIYFQEKESPKEYPQEAPFTISELEQIYPKASAKSKQDQTFLERAHMATLKLQNGDLAYRALWNHIRNVSITDLKKNYENLNTEFELWKGESDVQNEIAPMLENMVNQKIAYESRGALVVDVAEETDTKEIPPCLIQKSDGAALYATSDLATIIERERLYHPDYYIYLADKRQELHFIQVFRTAKKAGLVPDDRKMQFLGFGTMNGKDGKPFKTREGGVMRLEYLIEEINEAVYQKIQSGQKVPEEEARQIAKVVGLAALKYGDLSNQIAKDYVFDVERFSSLEGDTGPYILYTMVRIKSILKKYEELTGQKSELCKSMKGITNRTKSEINLMLTAAGFSEMITGAIKENAPHKICQYIYALANAFNSFYHENKIITEEDKQKQQTWIAQLRLLFSILSVCIDLLGFEVPDRM